MPRTISSHDLIAATGTDRFPHVVDVRRLDAFRNSAKRIAGSMWRDHMKTSEWVTDFDDARQIVVCCVHGHNVSALAATRLAESASTSQSWREASRPIRRPAASWSRVPDRVST